MFLFRYSVSKMKFHHNYPKLKVMSCFDLDLKLLGLLQLKTRNSQKFLQFEI